MRVLVVGEGKHELTDENPSSPLVELVRRMLPADVEFHREKVSSPKVRTHRLRGKAEAAYEKRALAWLSYATRESFDALILLIDHDGEADREKGIERAQNDTRMPLRRAMGVAIRTFDAWMLADNVALGQALDCSVPVQRSPEGVRDPKSVCKRLQSDSACELGLTEVYFRVARVVDLDRLKTRCPRGFGPFANRVGMLGQEAK